jgi:SPRY domain
VTCFEDVNQELTKNGKKRLEIIFVSQYQKKADFDEHYGTMVTPSTKSHFMAIDFPHSLLSRAIKGGFEITDDYTCLVLMKKDGTVLSTNYETADQINFTRHWGFPWNEEGVARGKKKIEALLKEEDERCEQIQKEMGVPLIRRMIGNGNLVKHIPEERIIRQYHCEFVTYGMQDTVVTSGSDSNYKASSDAGVFYYEIELLKVGPCFQFGFCAPGALDELVAEQSCGKGNGDAKDSWAFCGIRGELWTNGKANSWSCPKLKDVDIVGMAVNVGAGKIAVSVNGGEFAVVFEDDAIKPEGVFPCFSFGSDFELRVNATQDTFKHDGPAAEVWLLSPAAEEEPKSNS